MTKLMILQAINDVAMGTLYKASNNQLNAVNYLSEEEIDLISITDVNIDQAAWKVCGELVEWCNRHYTNNK